MPTLKEYRAELSRKLSGFLEGTVSLDPDVTDTLAQRSILSVDLFDANRGIKGYAGQYCWVGKYRDQRRFAENGYRSLAYAVFTPPTSGTYTITLYGYGQTAAIAYNATADDIEQAIADMGSSIGTVTVSGDGSPYIIQLPDTIDTEISGGTVLAQGGVGALEVTRPFTRALVTGDAFELHSKIPVLDMDNIQGLNTIINMALRRCWFIDRFPITPVRNSRGVKTFVGLSNETWLQERKQMIALYAPTFWENSAIFTPPGSSTYTLTLRTYNGSVTTASLAYTATGAEIETALEAVSSASISVSPQTAAASYTITVTNSNFAQPSFTASAGTITNDIYFLESPSRYANVSSFQWDGESPYIDNVFGQEGYSFLVEAFRQAHTWVCPQTSYGTPGTVWESSTTGLFNDYDRAIPSVENVAAIAYAIACDQMVMSGGPAQEVEWWRDEARKAHRIAAAVKSYDLPWDSAPTGGVMNAGAWGTKGVWGKF